MPRNGNRNRRGKPVSQDAASTVAVPQPQQQPAAPLKEIVNINGTANAAADPSAKGKGVPDAYPVETKAATHTPSPPMEREEAKRDSVGQAEPQDQPLPAVEASAEHAAEAKAERSEETAVGTAAATALGASDAAVALTDELISPSSCSSSSAGASADVSPDTAPTNNAAERKGKKKNRVRFSTEPPVILGADPSPAATTTTTSGGSDKHRADTRQESGSNEAAGWQPAPVQFNIPTFANARCSTPSTGDAPRVRSEQAGQRSSPGVPPRSSLLATLSVVGRMLSPQSPLVRNVVLALVKFLIGVVLGSVLPAKLLLAG